MVGDILWGEERETDTGKQSRRFVTTVGEVEVEPLDQGLEDDLLAGNVEVVRGEEVLQLLRRQQHELLVLRHLDEVVLRELACKVPQLQAGLSISKKTDANAVGRVEQLLEECTAGLDDGGQLEEAGGGGDALDGVLLQVDLARVAVVDQLSKSACLHALDHHPVHPLLHHPPREHGGKVVRGGGEEEAVAGKGSLSGDKGDICEDAACNKTLQ